MTQFEVVITRRASQQLNAAADWIAERAPETAEVWFARFLEQIQSLANHPRRGGRALEDREMSFELREMLVGRRRQWRVLFTIREQQVLVMAVRHAAQQNVTIDDLLPSDEATE